VSAGAFADHRTDHRRRRRAALLSLLVSTGLLGLKYLAWVWTGSSAILADALESIVNVVAALFALGSLAFAAQPADPGHPYGHGKIEFVSAAFEGGLIAFAALMIAWTAGTELWRGPQLRELESGLVLTAGAGLINAGLGWWLVRTGRRTRSLALVADGQHVLSDFWTSAGVVAGLLLVRATGLVWIDPLVALAVGINLGATGLRLAREAAGGLLDEQDMPTIHRLVAAMNRVRDDGIIDIHRLRAIRAGRHLHVDGHVIVPEYWSVEQAHQHTEAFVERVLDASGLEGGVILHVDPCRRAVCSRCVVPGCPLRREPGRAPAPITALSATRTEEAWLGGP